MLGKKRKFEDNNEPFGDGSHIIYVNAQYEDDSQIGKLMHDFNCSNPGDMKYSYLAKKATFFKEETEGVTHMCQIWEEIKAEGFAEGKAEVRISTAEKMLLKNQFSTDMIAEISGLTVEEVEKLKEKLSA